MTGLGTVIGGVVVVVPKIVTRHLQQIRVPGVHAGIQDCNHDRRVAIAEGAVPGGVGVGIKTHRADTRAGVGRTAAELGSIVVAPVGAVQGVVGNGRRKSDPIRMSNRDVGVAGQALGDGLDVGAVRDFKNVPAVGAQVRCHRLVGDRRVGGSQAGDGHVGHGLVQRSQAGFGRGAGGFFARGGQAGALQTFGRELNHQVVRGPLLHGGGGLHGAILHRGKRTFGSEAGTDHQGHGQNDKKSE